RADAAGRFPDRDSDPVRRQDRHARRTDAALRHGLPDCRGASGQLAGSGLDYRDPGGY
nr:hypothetical protein [Tanacetum cinerariifolium]